jgi:ribosome-associated toxin RatA of RatAB toxin-antitoxin module
MPCVEVVEIMSAPVDKLWAVINDVESYPRFMDHVRSLAVVENGTNYRLLAWEVDCKGFIMRWTEREEIDRERYRIDFRQIKGDLAQFEGFWQLEPLADDCTQVKLSVQFDMGIPMLAEMLNPVAERAIRDNSRHMLLSIASEAGKTPVAAGPK